MSTKRLAIFDIDGTLVTMKKTILPSTLTAIKQLQERGVHVAIATGRNYKMAQSVIAATHIHDYVVCNGSAIFVNDQLVSQRSLDRDDVTALTEYIRTIGTNILAESATELYADRMPDPVLEDVIAGTGTFMLPGHSYGLEHDIVQGLAIISPEQEQKAPELKHTIFKRFGPIGVDVLPADGSKARGIDRLAATLGVANADIVAFGDNQNDKEMLASVGTGIAMGHATPDVQATADWVTADSESDGIMKGLQHIGWL